MKTNLNSGIDNWLKHAGQYRLLSQEEVTVIARQIQSLPENDAKRKRLVNKLVKHNLRLVVRFVKTFMGNACHNKWGGPETTDYLQVGAMGLIRAAEMFDPARGYTFSTYANHWIRSKVCRYNLKTRSAVFINEASMRRLVFYNRNGYISSKNTNKRLDDKTASDFLREIQHAVNCVSLNIPNENGFELLDIVPSGEKQSQFSDIAESLHDAMDRAGITPLGKEILIGTYGYEESIAQLSERLNVTQNKIRTEKKTALSKARSSPALQKMV